MKRGQVDAQALYDLPLPGREAVAYGHVVELQVVAILQEVAGDDAAAGLDVAVFGIGRPEHVVGTSPLQPHAVFTHVEDLIA